MESQPKRQKFRKNRDFKKLTFLRRSFVMHGPIFRKKMFPIKLQASINTYTAWYLLYSKQFVRKFM
jgi:hypothetical protein